MVPPIDYYGCVPDCYGIDTPQYKKWSLLGTYEKIGKTVDITINVGDTPLEQGSEHKFLGMWIDKNMNWTYHIITYIKCDPRCLEDLE